MGRLFTPAAKFAICKSGIAFVAEAMEVLGGSGYCEESELPRLYREMPVNSIWKVQEYYVPGRDACSDEAAGGAELLAAECAEVKGKIVISIGRGGSCSSGYGALTKNRTGDYPAGLSVGVGAQVLRFASPPLAEAWCRMMLDTRGGMRLDEQTLDDLLLRATGRGRLAPQA